ncbi:MAG: glycosyltransferase family 39 protein [Candidatus Hinthialibacter antarcticus]|nr:glycosyltransferase family 39 protein [Candidatus Hinthialibacter antarcticus]
MVNDLLSLWTRKPFGLLLPLLLFALLTAITLPNPYVYHQDENYYMNSTRSMLAQSEFFVPSYNNVPRINKPIGFYWLMLSFQSILGHGFASSRMASWLFSLGMLIAAYYSSGWIFADEKRRALTVWVLASMDVFYRYAHYAVPEMTLAFFMACAHLAAWRWLTTRRTRDLLFLYLGAGLAFNIKGPVGILLPFAVTAAYLCLNQRRHELKRLMSFPGALLLLAIITPWYFMLMAKLGPMRLLTMMGQETAGRVFSLENSPAYYLPVLLLYFAPWSWFPLLRLRQWLQKNNRQSFGQALKRSYPFVWFATYVLFYSLIVGEKHQWYSLQWSLPLALLCVQALMPSGETPRFHKTYWFIGVLGAIASTTALSLHLLLGDIVYSTGAAVMLSSCLALGVISLAISRTPAARILSVAVWLLFLHCIIFQAVLPSKQLFPVTKFALQLQQQVQPFELLVNERYFHKKLFLFDIPSLTFSQLEKHENLFQAKLHEHRPTFALCRKSVFDAMDLTMQNGYEIVSSGYCKKEKEHEKREGNRLARWVRFIQTADKSHIIEPIYLLKKKEPSTPPLAD